MTADDGSAAVAVTLAGAVQPDAESTGIGDPLTRCTEHPGDCRGHRRQIVRLDLRDPALRERLAQFFARYQFDSEFLGHTQNWRDQLWEYNPPSSDSPRAILLQIGYLTWGELLADALLAELGRGAG